MKHGRNINDKVCFPTNLVNLVYNGLIFMLEPIFAPVPTTSNNYARFKSDSKKKLSRLLKSKSGKQSAVF